MVGVVTGTAVLVCSDLHNEENFCKYIFNQQARLPEKESILM